MTLTVYSLPASGGSFVAQLGLLSELAHAQSLYSRRHCRPDLVLSASGGNVAAYLGMGADWRPEGILRLTSKLEPEMFVASWFPPALDWLPTSLIGIFKGSVYRPGYGGRYLFESVFNPQTVTETEIWSGTYDVTNRRAQFFCNRSEEKALIKPWVFDDDAQLYGTMPLKYLGGEIPAIAEMALASASIPFLVQGREVDGLTYLDGGTMFASPTIAFVDEVLKLAQGRKYRGYYFACYDLDTPEVLDATSTFGVSALNQLLHAGVLADRAEAVRILYQLNKTGSKGVQHRHYPFLQGGKIRDLLERIEASQGSVCVFYPGGSPTVSITSFTVIDIVQAIEATRRDYGAHLWTF